VVAQHGQAIAADDYDDELRDAANTLAAAFTV
jgi:hypothetical protein